jgi:hypothetical protein
MAVCTITLSGKCKLMCHYSAEKKVLMMDELEF